MWCPGDAVERANVMNQLCNRSPGHSDIQNDRLRAVSVDGSNVVRILLVPGEPQEWCEVTRFIQNSTVLQGSEVEHSQRTIGAHCAEDVLPTRKGNVVDFLVVRYQLRLGHHRVDVPDGAGGVDGTCADDGRVRVIPVETRQRSAIFCVFVVVQHAFHGYFIFFREAPQPQIISCRGQQISFSQIVFWWYPHDLCCWVRMFKLTKFVELSVPLVVLLKFYYLELV
mmetsp:Transcript_35862/g.61728  ORF Transcript_35862/g.61728 Transcript_35862/m.61728 type:complete len:225 (+) Transcript_35862:388-1062(+)